MNALRLALLPALILLSSTGHVLADDPPSYVKQIKPFLTKYCLECHNNSRARGQVNVETYEMLVKTGRKGRPALVPGDPDKSRLVLTTEGKVRPMPPRKAKQPHADEKGLLRAWVAAGAKDDSKADAGMGVAPTDDAVPPAVTYGSPAEEGPVSGFLWFCAALKPLGLLARRRRNAAACVSGRPAIRPDA
jgi:hypothetical protein